MQQLLESFEMEVLQFQIDFFFCRKLKHCESIRHTLSHRLMLLFVNKFATAQHY